MINFLKLFDLSHTRAQEFMRFFTFASVPRIGMLVEALGRSINKDEFKEVCPNVWIHKDASVAKSAKLLAPCIIDAGSELRHCAFIRGGVLVGKNCVVGNSVELKNSILFDGAQVPHFNYVGDSVLGYRAHLGAGAITSNIKSDKSNVTIQNGTEKIDTGLRKFGALVGDNVEVGCNSVLNPGTIIGKNTSIYPLSSVRGVIPENCIYKGKNDIIEKS